MNQDNIRILLPEHRSHPGKDPLRDVKQRLAFLHDREIVVRYNAECVQHGVKHLPMLSGNANKRFYISAGFQLKYKGTHFDRFRTGAEYKHDFFHKSSLSYASEFFFIILPCRKQEVKKIRKKADGSERAIRLNNDRIQFSAAASFSSSSAA